MPSCRICGREADFSGDDHVTLYCSECWKHSPNINKESKDEKSM